MAGVNVNNFPDLVGTLNATITSGFSVSDSQNCRGTSLASIIIPATFTGTAISFQVSYDDINFGPLRDLDTNAVVSFAIQQGGYYCIRDLAIFVGFPFLKVVSNATEVGDRLIILGLRRFV